MRRTSNPFLITPAKALWRTVTGVQKRTWAGLYLVTLLAACAGTKPPEATPPPDAAMPEAPLFRQPVATPIEKLEPKEKSQAATARDYRRDAARHLYGLNESRIFKGQLPPLVHAVAVLTMQLDNLGNIVHLHWSRAPSHAPEVVQEIERTVRAAAPFPAPVKMGGVIYTDIWLWDRSGQFQLDTLTEGQRRK